MSDYVDKKKELYSYFPAPFYNIKSGQGLGIILDVIGEQKNELAYQTQQARNQYLLSRAVGKYLQDHGLNVDVMRPKGYKMPDSVYRELIKITTNSSKNIERIFERILRLYFGDNCIENGTANVYFITPNELIVEIKENALIIASRRDLYGTTYIHATHDGFDGESIDLWSSSLPSTLAIGATGFTFLTVPTDMPTRGFIHFGSDSSPTEVKGYYRVGNNIYFLTPTIEEHLSGEFLGGPKYPDDYPSGYIYDREIRSDLVGSYSIGATSIQLGVNLDDFPLEGTIYIGTPGATNFEAKGYTRASLNSSTFNLKGGLAFAHSSGDQIVIPCINRKIKSYLTSPISAGSTHSELFVDNSSSFPVVRGCVKLNGSFGNEELVPFIKRPTGNNSKILIDPGYVFKFDHSIGEKVQLMANKTAPSKDGLNWPVYLNDTDSLRAQFYNLMRRLKATGVKIVFELL